MSAWEVGVHSERDGRARCGHPRAREVSADREAVTCQMCLNLLDGGHGSHGGGYQWADVKPCGTTAAYRRHLRRDGKPVRCESCLQAERRRNADSYRDMRRAS